MRTITSRQNPAMKELKKLHSKRYREERGRFVAEGEDLLAEALKVGSIPETLYLSADSQTGFEKKVDLNAIRVDPSVLASVSSLGSGSRVIGVWPTHWGSVDGAENIVYLHGVADPGNVGTIIRSMHALIEGVVALGPGCADPFSPKAVRASMGSIFARPPAQASFDSVAEQPVCTVGLSPGVGEPLHELDFRKPVAFCLGAEREGLDPGILARCDRFANIPLLQDGAESLNVAIAASLALYQASLL